MDEKQVVSKINEYLHAATKELCEWLKKNAATSNR